MVEANKNQPRRVFAKSLRRASVEVGETLSPFSHSYKIELINRAKSDFIICTYKDY